MNRWWMLTAPLILLACGPDPELVKEKEQLETKVADLEKEKGRLEKEASTLHAQVRRLEESVASMKRREVFSKIGIEEGQKLEARLDTTKGRISCALWPDKAPATVLNFVQLAEGTKTWIDPITKKEVKRPLYDGTIFHRVIPEFMIQGGDPLGTGMGGPGYEFEDETDNGVGFDEPGLLAMANHGPGTNGSQFFITDRATPHHLDGKHTIFGKCENLDVVQAIATAEKGARDRPKTDVAIKHLAIVR